MQRRYEQFIAGERAAMSGLSQIARRRLETRGYLPKVENGWSRVPAHDVARDQVFAALLDLGLPPSRIQGVADLAAPVVTLFALHEPGAVADPQNLNILGEPPIQVSDGMLAEQRFVVSLPDDCNYLSSIDGFTELARHGAFVVLDLHALGAQLAARAPRPLCTWEPE